MASSVERTLPTGEKVRRYPGGHEILVSTGSLRSQLEGAEKDCCGKFAQLRQRRQDRLSKAKAAMADVPPEKRCI